MDWQYSKMTRRRFFTLSGTVLASLSGISLFSTLAGCASGGSRAEATAAGTAAGAGVAGTAAAAGSAGGSKPDVFFTRTIDAESLQKLYARINQDIGGKVAIKLHSGEPHGPNLLPVDLIKSLQGTIPNSTIVECNVMYGGPRQTTAGHLETLKTNGFDFCPVDIMDADGDAALPIGAGRRLKEVAVGKHLLNYDSMLVYTHFKGHTMGGFGGSLKNIAIGCASGQVGKRQIHGDNWETGPAFLERMVESGYGITDHFKSHITYINVLKNLSVDCDCDAHGAPSTMADIGIIASRDILAADQASVDLVYAAAKQSGNKDLTERIESRQGLHQLEYMQTLNMGSREYNLVEV